MNPVGTCGHTAGDATASKGLIFYKTKWSKEEPFQLDGRCLQGPSISPRSHWGRSERPGTHGTRGPWPGALPPRSDLIPTRREAPHGHSTPPGQRSKTQESWSPGEASQDVQAARAEAPRSPRPARPAGPGSAGPRIRSRGLSFPSAWQDPGTFRAPVALSRGSVPGGPGGRRARPPSSPSAHDRSHRGCRRASRGKGACTGVPVPVPPASRSPR